MEQIKNKEVDIIEEVYGSYNNDMYKYCPLCGVDWINDNLHKCDKMILVNRKKPRFYILDLDNYNEDFLKKIILWQELKIKALQDINSISANDVDLKHF